MRTALLCFLAGFAACSSSEATVTHTAVGLLPSRCSESPNYCDPETVATTPIGHVVVASSHELHSLVVSSGSDSLVFSLKADGTDTSAPFEITIGSATEINTLTVFVYATHCSFDEATFTVTASIRLGQGFGLVEEIDQALPRTYTVSFTDEDGCPEPEPDPEPEPEPDPETSFEFGPCDANGQRLARDLEFANEHWTAAIVELSEGASHAATQSSFDVAPSAIDAPHRVIDVNGPADAVEGFTIVDHRQTEIRWDPEVDGEPAAFAVQFLVRASALEDAIGHATVTPCIFQDVGGTERVFVATAGDALFVHGDVIEEAIEIDVGEFLDPLNWVEPGSGLSIDFAAGPMAFGFRIEFNAPVTDQWTFRVDDFRVVAHCADPGE